jgi:hypothetical protein
MMPDPLSFTCVLKDPNGNFVEVSVFRGVHEKAREV